MFNRYPGQGYMTGVDGNEDNPQAPEGMMATSLIGNLKVAQKQHKMLLEAFGPPGLVLLEKKGYITDEGLHLNDYLYELLCQGLSSSSGKVITELTTFDEMEVHKLKPGWETRPIAGVCMSF